MATYAYPEMPLRAAVWYEALEPPLADPPDATDIPVSLSPCKPEDYFRRTIGALGSYDPSHIIRTATSARFTESYRPGQQSEAYPCTIFEIPGGSGHLYITVWAHVVGAGFANEHARIYCTRYPFAERTNPPLFHGWI